MPILVDSNVILDLVTQDSTWLDWSKSALERYSSRGLMANAMVYAELCGAAETSSDVDALMGDLSVTLLEIPREALFLAAKAHLSYRRKGGSRTTGLPDFFIGAHAQSLGIPILTRDRGRYQSYFPNVSLICPQNQTFR